MQQPNPYAAQRVSHHTGAIYARISDDPKERRWGVERQVKDCLEAAALLGVTVPEKYIFIDNDRSAFKDNVHRPAYEQFEHVLKTEPEVTLFFAYKIDRVWRQTDKQITFYKEVMLRNAVEGFLTRGGGFMELETAEGWRRACNAATEAEVYSRIVSENSRRARLELAREGVRHVTARPYGWEQKGDVIRPDEAVVVQEIVKRLIAGETSTAIARSLNERGVPTIKGAKWTGIGVRKTATRASNAGLREHHGVIYDGTWEPIISRDEWERVCHVVSQPVRAYKRGTGRKYWLTGYAYCAECGKKLSVGMGRSNEGRAAYRCDPRKSNESTKSGCGRVQRQQIPLDWLVRELIIRHLDGDALRNAVAQINSDETRVQELTTKLREQRDFIDGLVASFGRQELQMSVAEFNRAKLTAEARLGEINRELRQINPAGIMNKLDFTKSLRDQIENADTYVLREIAEVVIKRVLIKPQAKSGWKVRWIEIDGVRYRFDADLVEIEWQV